MPYPWLCLWDRTLDLEKAQTLPPIEFKAWINLLCLANRQEPRGTLPAIKSISFALRTDEKKAKALVEKLVKAGLVDRDGETLEMHDWESWQCSIQTSAERSKEYRQNKRERAQSERSPSAQVSAQPSDDEALSSHARVIELDLIQNNTPHPPIIPPPEKSAIAIPVIGPEYTPVGEMAMELSGCLSWGTWVDSMGKLGHPAESIRLAIEQAAGAGKLTKPYVASILRGWAASGGPPRPAANKPRSFGGQTEKLAPYQQPAVKQPFTDQFAASFAGAKK